MATIKFNADYHSAVRPSFPGEEAVESWLPTLLDAYYIVDQGIAEGIDLEEKDRGVQVACKNHCSSCCQNQSTIPVYPNELVGLSWYATEKVEGSERETLKKQLREYTKESPCPFLVEDSCVAHPLRPMSCRLFIVFGRVCDKEEDPYYTRRKDVHTPIQDYIDQAYYTMLPFYGVQDEIKRLEAVQNKDMHKVITLIQDCKWSSLADKMDDFDQKRK